MDKLDKKIILELFKDSRVPINQLSKKVGASREVVNYRVDKLIKNGIIKNFYTNINLEKLGFTRNACFCRLKNISKKKEQAFLNFLVKHPFVTFAGPVLGKWNIIFDILSKNKTHLSKIKKEIEDRVAPFLDNLVIVNSPLHQEVFPNKILDVNNRDYLASQQKGNLESFNPIDLRIMKAFAANSRIELIQLSKKLKLTPNAIKYRIKNLKENGYLLNNTISVEIKKFGFEWYNLQVNYSGIDIKFNSFLRNHPQVTYFYMYAKNKWKFDIGVIAKNSEHLRDFILELRENFGDSFSIYDLYLILEESKADLAPEGIFEK